MTRGRRRALTWLGHLLTPQTWFLVATIFVGAWLIGAGGPFDGYEWWVLFGMVMVAWAIGTLDSDDG